MLIALRNSFSHCHSSILKTASHELKLCCSEVQHTFGSYPTLYAFPKLNSLHPISKSPAHRLELDPEGTHRLVVSKGRGDKLDREQKKLALHQRGPPCPPCLFDVLDLKQVQMILAVRAQGEESYSIALDRAGQPQSEGRTAIANVLGEIKRN